jgi:hypothetical protein
MCGAMTQTIEYAFREAFKCSNPSFYEKVNLAMSCVQ